MVSVPAWGKLLAIWTVMLQLTLAPLTRPGLVQLTTPALSEQAALALTKLVPAARPSRRVKPALSEGPRLSTVRVSVSSVPAVAGSGAAVLVTLRSALRLTVVVLVLELLALTGSAV